MIGNKFIVSDKTYVIKKELTLGEYRRISNVNSNLNKLSHKISDNATPEELQSIASDFSDASDSQLTLICEFLESHLGLNQKTIDALSLVEAIQVFQEAFKQSTTPNKELKKTSN